MRKDPAGMHISFEEQGFCVAPTTPGLLKLLDKLQGTENLVSKMLKLPRNLLCGIFQSFKEVRGTLTPDTKSDQRRMLLLTKNGKTIVGKTKAEVELREVCSIRIQ